jgi:exodeoxyribonuclease-3
MNSILHTRKLESYLEESVPDIICLQELKLNSFEETKMFEKYQVYVNLNKNRAANGVMILTKIEPIAVHLGGGSFGAAAAANEFDDDDARLITLEFDDYYLVCVYAPNPITSPPQIRLDWDAKFHQYIVSLKQKGKDIIIMGDLNVCPDSELDLHPILSQQSTSQQRTITLVNKKFQDLLQLGGLVDSFRECHPQVPKWTYWNSVSQARKKGEGRRLDYALVTSRMMKTQVQDSLIRDEVEGSDHCPIELYLSPKKEK